MTEFVMRQASFAARFDPRLKALTGSVCIRPSKTNRPFYEPDTDSLRNLERRTLHALWRAAHGRALHAVDA
jgi:hypothetical protein